MTPLFEDRQPRRDLLAAVLASAALLVVYVAFRQSHYWSDGRFLIFWLENDRWSSRHFAYLPVAQLVHRSLGRILSWDPETSLAFLSAACGALSGGLTLWSCRRVALGWPATVVGAALVASAPVVWFYATSIEVHALQLLGGSTVLAWAASSHARGRLGGNTLAPVLLLAAVALPHMVGVTWGLPLAALVLLDPGHRRLRLSPAKAGTLLAMGALAGGLWLRSQRFPVSRRDLSIAASGGHGAGISLELAWAELVAPAGVLYGLVLVAALALSGGRVASLRNRSALLSLLAFAALAPFALIFEIRERGAYFITLVPLLALWCAVGLDRLRAPVVWTAGLLLVAAQVHLSLAQVRDWETSVDLPAWVLELELETEGNALVFTTSKPGANSVSRHTSMVVIALVEGSPADPASAEARRRSVAFAAARAGEGFRVGLMEDVLVSDAPGVRALVDALRARLGEPRPYGEAPLRLFPAD